MKRQGCNRALSVLLALAMTLSLLCVPAAAREYDYTTAVVQGDPGFQTAVLMTLGTTTPHPSVYVKYDTPSGTPLTYEGSYYWLNAIGEVYDISAGKDVQLQIKFSAGMNAYSDELWKNNGMRYAYVYDAKTGDLVANWLNDGTAAGQVNSSGMYQLGFGLYNGTATPANQYGVVYTIPNGALAENHVYWLVLGSATCGNNNQKMLYYPIIYEFTTSDAFGEGEVDTTADLPEQNEIVFATLRGEEDTTSAAGFNRYGGGSGGSGASATYGIGDPITASYPGQEIAIKQSAQLEGTTFTLNVRTDSGALLPLHTFVQGGGSSANLGDIRFTMPTEAVSVYAIFGYPTTVSVVEDSEEAAPVEGAAVTIRDPNTGCVFAPESDGSYIIPKGTYELEVSAEGYETYTGTLDNTAEQTHVCRLTLERFDTISAFADFDHSKTVPAGTAESELDLPATLSATVNGQAAQVPVTWQTDAEKPYDPAVADTYTFTAVVDSQTYQVAEGVQMPTFQVTVEAAKATLTFQTTPANATVVLKDGESAVVEPQADGSYRLTPGTYTYTVSASGYQTAEGTVTIENMDVVKTVALTFAGGGSSGGSSGGGSSSGGNTTTTTTTKNPDGSTTTTVTNKTTGTVTETTKFQDGSVQTVETKKDGTVTTTDQAKNGVTAVTVDKPGQSVTATVTLPAGVDSATVTLPAEVTPGTVAVNAETGEALKRSVPTEDGLTVRLDGSVKLVLEDRSKDFTDTAGHWGAASIDFVTARGMFTGTSDATFSPDAKLTRGMIVQVLYQFDGADPWSGGNAFDDVAADAWYADAVGWAAAQGIVAGYGNDSFGPEDNITREQMVMILYNYAKSKGYDVSGSADLSRFSDHADVNGYGIQALGWAVNAGLITGVGGNKLAPQATATRAEVAAVLMRFCEYLVK